MSQPPDIKAHLALHGPGVRVQFPGIGAVSISDIGMAKFLLAYPSAWASLDMVDPDRVAEASAGALTPRVVISIKQLLAAAVIREFPEPRSGAPVDPGELPGPLLSDAQEFITRASGTDDPDRLTAMIANLFDYPPAKTRRVVEAFQQRDAR